VTTETDSRAELEPETADLGEEIEADDFFVECQQPASGRQ
jgi:hypothetical protein